MQFSLLLINKSTRQMFRLISALKYNETGTRSLRGAELPESSNHNERGTAYSEQPRWIPTCPRSPPCTSYVPIREISSLVLYFVEQNLQAALAALLLLVTWFAERAREGFCANMCHRRLRPSRAREPVWDVEHGILPQTRLNIFTRGLLNFTFC